MLFIDEIHRLSRVVEEILYPAMEDFQIDVIIGQGPSARSIKLELKRFTLIGATTRAGLLTSPLRDRFGVSFRLDFYTGRRAGRRSCGARRRILNVPIDDDGARRDRAPRARHAAHRQPPAAPRARLRRRCAPQGVITARRRRRGAARCSRSTSAASTRWTAPSCWPSSTSSAAARSGSRRSPPRSARSATRSRTSTSRILIQEGFLSRTPKGRVATPRAYAPLRPRAGSPLASSQARLF